MTQDEAKAKWCPFARYKSLQGEGINRWVAVNDRALNPEPSRCIASDCMAWRWAGYRADSGEWVRRTAGEPWAPDKADCFCGLAGAQ